MKISARNQITGTDLYILADGFPEPGRRFFLTARLRN